MFGVNWRELLRIGSILLHFLYQCYMLTTLFSFSFTYACSLFVTVYLIYFSHTKYHCLFHIFHASKCFGSFVCYARICVNVILVGYLSCELKRLFEVVCRFSFTLFFYLFSRTFHLSLSLSLSIIHMHMYSRNVICCKMNEWNCIQACVYVCV